jgi:kynureninase
MSPELAEARALDAADPLRRLRELFVLPESLVYLDGNSLGALPRATVARQQAALREQWGEALVGAWNRYDWIGAPRRIGAKIAALIGARPHEVIVADSTSVNLFKLLTAAARLSDRPVILSEAGNFPTDLHVASGVADLLGRRLETAPRGAIEARIGGDVAALVLTHVHYRTAERYDMAALNARARAAGAPIVWDLSHSAGAVPLDLHRDGAELAIGCGYKYLNGGPGAPAFLYVAERLQERLVSPLRGWFGHSAPFDFTDDYTPAAGIDRFMAGTPPILSLFALESGVETFEGVAIESLWAKSVALFDFFLASVERECAGHDLACISPRDSGLRGSHIAFRHPDAFALCQALIEAGVIGDFRTPDTIRFGLTPLYLGFDEIRRAVAAMREILESASWREPRFALRGKVT